VAMLEVVGADCAVVNVMGLRKAREVWSAWSFGVRLELKCCDWLAVGQGLAVVVGQAGSSQTSLFSRSGLGPGDENAKK
jgi:hypothetical protein